MTRHRKAAEGKYGLSQAQAEPEYNDEIDKNANKVLDKETFKGINEILKSDPNLDSLAPIVFIIKNIKTFNPIVLNDLIHLLRKYREE